MTVHAFPHSRDAATARIARISPASYARSRNHLKGAVTGVSPWVTHGVLTLPEILADLLTRDALPIGHKLVYEFGWREFFRHVWSFKQDTILQSLHQGPLDDAAYSPVLPLDIREARTGVPVVDQAVHTLYATGTLHNHARMWLASYIVHLRKVHWRAGADWLVAHLLDGDLASNHLSWQWVAGTGSHKPYLFNAENVARYAPESWHSSGSVIDCAYEALDRIARSPRAILPDPARARAAEIFASAEPPLLQRPPADLRLSVPDADTLAGLQDRDVWLVHPWALRAPPADLAPNTAVIGVYLGEHHAAWPWPAARWRWVDAAMAAITPERWFIDASALAGLLAKTARRRAVDDPHVSRYLASIAELAPAPALFRSLDRQSASFSHWWSRVTRGLRLAEELL